MVVSLGDGERVRVLVGNGEAIHSWREICAVGEIELLVLYQARLMSERFSELVGFSPLSRGGVTAAC